MEKTNETIMEIARALMDFFPGLDMVDAISTARHSNITLAAHS